MQCVQGVRKWIKSICLCILRDKIGRYSASSVPSVHRKAELVFTWVKCERLCMCIYINNRALLWPFYHRSCCHHLCIGNFFSYRQPTARNGSHSSLPERHVQISYNGYVCIGMKMSHGVCLARYNCKQRTWPMHATTNCQLPFSYIFSSQVSKLPTRRTTSSLPTRIAYYCWRLRTSMPIMHFYYVKMI